MTTAKIDNRSVSDLHEAAMAHHDRSLLAERRGQNLTTIRQHAASGLVDEIAAASRLIADPHNEPTRGVLYQSAASMAYRAGCWTLARELIARAREGSPDAKTLENLIEIERMVGIVRLVQ